MGLLFNRITADFEIFILVLIRMTGLFLISPIFGRRNIPAYMKIGFSLLLSYIVLSGKILPLEFEITGWIQLIYCVMKELLVGFIIGFITPLAFSAVWTAGQILDNQIGFGIINVIDPQNNIQVPLMANFHNMLALLLFFTVDGHHKLIQIIFNSYDVVPLGTGIMTERLSAGMIRLFADSFLLAVRIAIPIIAASVLSVIAFGLLARVVPQINIFIIEIPFKIFIGLVVLIVIVPVIVESYNNIFSNMFDDITSMLRELSPK